MRGAEVSLHALDGDQMVAVSVGAMDLDDHPPSIAQTHAVHAPHARREELVVGGTRAEMRPAEAVDGLGDRRGLGGGKDLTLELGLPFPFGQHFADHRGAAADRRAAHADDVICPLRLVRRGDAPAPTRHRGVLHDVGAGLGVVHGQPGAPFQVGAART